MRLLFEKKTFSGEALEALVDEDANELVVTVDDKEVLRCPNTKEQSHAVYTPLLRSLTKDRPEAPKKTPSKASKKKSPKSGGGD